MVRKKSIMFELLALLERLKRHGSTKEDVLSAVNSVFASPVAPVRVAAPVCSVQPTPVKVEQIAPVVAAAPVSGCVATVDFARISLVRKGFAGQQKQDQFKACVNGKLEDLPALSQRHCQQAWSFLGDTPVRTPGWLEKGKFLARGLALREKIESIEDLLDPEKFNFSGVASWSNMVVASDYTHDGWYQRVYKTASFIPGSFLMLIIDAESQSKPKYLCSDSDNSELAKTDNWMEGETLIYLPPEVKIDVSKCFKHTYYTGEQTWFVKL